ncbi:MAG: YvcK family protein [Endomicrobium sp.]|jgi:uncharacterized cofD-like protein|nr:YvcK family protein [Endomicrobium sp.]
MKKTNIVAIGGGTGLSCLLRGLKKYNYDITAVVNVADDGGSSGKLRTELGILPPGDIRSCLVALSEEESLMSELFKYRFPAKGSLNGHSFGNLFLTAMSAVTGGFDNAVTHCGQVLAVKGRVLPVTLSSISLEAELDSGEKVKGEQKISKVKEKIKKVYLTPDSSQTTREVISAFRQADVIIIGPGSLYTSIIVNLLIGGVVSAIKRSKAYKIYIGNIMTQPGETRDYKLSDHIAAIENNSYENILDCAVVNNKTLPEKLLKKYKRYGAYQVENDKIRIKTVRANLIADEFYVRHDSQKLARVLSEIIRVHIKR